MKLSKIRVCVEDLIGDYDEAAAEAVLRKDIESDEISWADNQVQETYGASTLRNFATQLGLPNSRSLEPKELINSVVEAGYLV